MAMRPEEPAAQTGEPKTKRLSDRVEFRLAHPLINFGIPDLDDEGLVLEMRLLENDRGEMIDFYNDRINALTEENAGLKAALLREGAYDLNGVWHANSCYLNQDELAGHCTCAETRKALNPKKEQGTDG